jgi:DNA polymerase-3 subunit alpha
MAEKRIRGPLAHSLSADKIEVHKEPVLVVRKVIRGNRKPMRFVSLHHHSTFSYLDGYQMPEVHVRRAEELLMGTLAMTEHGNVDSHVKFEEAIEKTKSGVKPIFGCEIYMVCPWSETGQRKMHLTVLAKNAVGYKNLLHLLTLAWKRKPDQSPVDHGDTGFRYEPTVNFKTLVEYKEGLIILSGCAGSLLFCSTVGGKGLDPKDASFKRGLKVAQQFKAAFGSNYFVEIQGFPELENTRRANPLLVRIARRIHARVVATMDCHYTALAEAEVQKMLHNLRPGEKRTLEEQERDWGYDVGLCPPLNDATLVRKLVATGVSRADAIAAVQTSADIGEECCVTLPRLPIPSFPLPKGWDSVKDYWRAQLNAGWKFRGFDKLPLAERKRYRERLRYEVDLIEQKEYVPYFLITQDAVVFIKDQGIPVGPARGSAAGSLAAFVLRITEVDPMRFPLLIFERFIDVTREDLPDIDLDFPSEVRDTGILRDYLASRYPSVANIGTFTYYKGKLALDDVARVYRVPKSETDVIKNFLIERSSGDLRASSTVEDTIEQFPAARAVVERYPDLRRAELLEGNVRGSGVHAAAYVVASQDIGDVAAIYHKKIGEVYADVVTFDKYDAERQGLLKMDFLGLSTMSALWQMLRWCGLTINDLYGIPIDDEKVYARFKLNDVTAVFQFDGRAMRSVSQILKPERFEEVMDCNALSRPGPLHNGAASAYAAIKFGRAKAERFHPAVDVITEPTQFQIVYQEQILRIVREVGDFPWTHAAYIRKIISRKIGEQEFNRSWGRFWEGCQTLHERTDYPPISEEQAKKVWGNMITSGSYAFNAAHCVAYGLLAYWTMWFKEYHPAEFYAASARHYGEHKQRDILRDADKHGVRILRPRLGRSDASWKPEGQMRIRAGYKQITGIGPKTSDNIIEAKPESWDELRNIKGIGPKTIEKIKLWIAQPDPHDIYRLEQSIKTIKAALEAGELEDENGRLPIPTHSSRELDEVRQGTRVVWIGEMVKYNIRDIMEINVARGNTQDISEIKDPHLREFAIIYARDEDDQTMLKVNRWRFPRYKADIFNSAIDKDRKSLMLVQGRKPRYGVQVDKMWIIAP